VESREQDILKKDLEDLTTQNRNLKKRVKQQRIHSLFGSEMPSLLLRSPYVEENSIINLKTRNDSKSSTKSGGKKSSEKKFKIKKY